MIFPVMLVLSKRLFYLEGTTPSAKRFFSPGKK